MKILICDDSPRDLAGMKELLEKYCESRACPAPELEQTSDSAALYRRIQNGEQWDVYILDILMSEKTGIDIGGLLHRTGAQSPIIYVTSSDDFALAAYGVHAVRYLLKPVREEQFFEALDYVLPRPGKKSGAVYEVKTKEGLVAVPCSRIEYVENSTRMLNVCLADGRSIKSIFIRKSFDEEIRGLTDDPAFLQVHNSFLVNMNYVDRLAQGNITMESGRCIPVSKARAAEVKKKYLMFVSQQYQ